MTHLPMLVQASISLRASVYPREDFARYPIRPYSQFVPELRAQSAVLVVGTQNQSRYIIHHPRCPCMYQNPADQTTTQRRGGWYINHFQSHENSTRITGVASDCLRTACNKCMLLPDAELKCEYTAECSVAQEANRCA